MSVQWGLILIEIDNLLLNNYWRKYYTYAEIGWDDTSIRAYLAQKANALQIASFNTPYVSFSASSRRNRFYEVYNRENMLDQDVAWEHSIEALNKIMKKYKIFVLTSRATDLKQKTLDVMKRLGFPLQEMEIIFKEPNEALHTYRQDEIKEIAKKYPSGISICLQGSDASLFTNTSYTPIGFTSIKEADDFNGQLSVVCADWLQVLHSLQCN